MASETTTSILHHYQHLQAPLGLSGFSQGMMKTKTETIPFHDPVALDQRITEYEPMQGWLCFQSLIARYYTAETLPLRDDKTGYLLNAEFVLPDKNGQTRSLHIRMSDQAWQLITITEEALNDCYQLIEKTSFLAMPEHVLVPTESTDSLDVVKKVKPTKQNKIPVINDFLTYRINWQYDKENGYQPALYRFTGFKRNVKHDI